MKTIKFKDGSKIKVTHPSREATARAIIGDNWREVVKELSYNGQKDSNRSN